MAPPKLEKRRAPRATVALMATIRNATAMKTVRLRNLTSNGALVEGEALPMNGPGLMFERNGLSVRTCIVWVRGLQCGIRFEEPVQVKAALRHISKPKSVSAPRSARPGLKCRPLSEADKLVLERWSVLGLSALGN